MYNNLQIQIHIQNSKQVHTPKRHYIGQEQQINEWENKINQNLPTSFFMIVSFFVLVITTFTFINQQPKTNLTVHGAQFYQYWQYQVCMVIQNSKQSNQSFIKLVRSLQNQTFKDWKAFYYIDSTHKQYNQRTSIINTSQINHRFTILNSYKNTGMNNYDGINNQCQTYSLVILLDEGQTFYNQSSLYLLRKYFQKNDHIYIIGTGVDINGTHHQPNEKEIVNFERFQYFQNSNGQKLSTLQQIYANITTHVKAFKLHFFKDIMPFDLMNLNDQFYQTKAAFLFPLLQMCTKCTSQCKYPGTSFTTDNGAYARMPNIIKITDQIYFTSVNKLPQLNPQINQVFFKHTYKTLAHKYYLSHRLMLDKPKIVGQNIKKGQLNLLKRNYTKQKKLIPKNINQFWISYGQLSPFKKKLTEILKQKHEGYFYKMWGLDDITRQNFPLTYDTLKKLISLDKIYGYTRMSMVADLMRLEVLYHHGGFHCDLNYEFRHFPLIMQTQQMYFTPDSFSMGLFAAQKGSPYIKKLLSPQRLSQISLKGLANIETGPRFFGSIITAEDFFFNMKVIPAQFGNAYFPWSNDARIQKCKCRFKQQVPIELKGKYNQTVAFDGGITIIPCSNMYPNAYGIDHFYAGGSWTRKKLVNSFIV